MLLTFLREHRSEWADSNIDAYSAAAVKATSWTSATSLTGCSGGQVILPLAHTLGHEEVSNPSFLGLVHDLGIIHVCTSFRLFIFEIVTIFFSFSSQFLEVIKLECISHNQETLVPRDLYLLQVCLQFSLRNLL